MSFPPQAFWIGSEHPFDLHEAYIDFERHFDLSVVPGRARLIVTADSRYKLWINGCFVSRGPARCWPHRQLYDVLDVSSHLRAGKNTINATVYSPGYSHFSYVHRGAHGLLLALEAEGTLICATDDTWSAARNRSWRNDVQRLSIYGSGVERQDMRRFDEAQWRTAKIVAPPEGTLWQGLDQRDVPILTEEIRALDAPVQVRQCRSPSLDDPHMALREIWSDPGDGAYAARVFDLGQSAVCFARIHAGSARGGERLFASYAENFRSGELVIPNPSTYCRMQPTDEFILATGDQTVEPFSMRGGRFLIVTCPRELEVRVDAVITRYPLKFTPLHFEDTNLQSIADLCLRTTLACLQDGFVDSVWRESSQWLGDGVAQAFALSAVSDDLRPLRRMITMAADGAYPDGVLPSVLPGEVHAYTITDYNFSWIELLHSYCGRATDGEEFLAVMRPKLDGITAHFRQQLDHQGLLRSEPGRRLFLDWSPVDRREPSLTYNGRYLHALQIAAQLTQSDIIIAEAMELRKNIRKHFNRSGHWFENAHGVKASQLGLSLALLTGCIESSATTATCNTVVLRSLDPDDGHSDSKTVLASPFMHYYVFLALERAGRIKEILDIISLRWGRWAAAGEATCWENWSVDFPDGSKCHGFSAHPLGWLHKYGTTKPTAAP